MRARRQTRSAFPDFSLALPTNSSRGEVQVQQKNQQDVNKFFIDVDDTMVSPVITTESRNFFAASHIGTARGAFPGLLSVDQTIPGNDTKAAATTHGIGTAATCGAQAPKFIHVNNTNIFVLMDGISMFFEGRSTFTGDEDPLVMQHILKKKSRKAVKKISVGDDGPENLDATAVSRQKNESVDTVEEAIRGIEQNVGQSLSPLFMTTRPSGPPSLVPSFSLSSNVSPINSAGEPALPSTLPSDFVSLFNNAKKPVHVPLFRRELAVPPRRAQVSSSPKVPITGTLSRLESHAGSPTLSEHNCSASSLNNDATTTADVTIRPMSVSSNQAVTGPLDQTAKPSKMKMNLRKSDYRPRQKPLTVADIGHSNLSLDLDEAEILNYIGGGSQGKVYRVMLDGKLYALKRMDVKEVTEAPNAVERQGRKRGLVKELNMIRFQRDSPPPKYLMQMFNAVATLDHDRQQLNLLIELMSFAVEDAQKMVARIPQTELMKITQSTFRHHMSGNNSQAIQDDLNRLLKEQHGSCMRIMGRSSFGIPEEWETNCERQTAMPEIILSMLADDVLRGLRELHRDYGIVHCDLKPANVLLSFGKESFKLADFGCGCQMDRHTQMVHRNGVDLGSKLYKAPERLTADQGSVDGSGVEPVKFGCKADVWSLGVMLLELSCGVHPCNFFKSDFWNYLNLLKLSKMIKPMGWSSAFCDFIVRCLYVDVEHRWSVEQLLHHPFILRYDSVPRNKLKSFMERLESDSANFQRKQQRETLAQQIFQSTSQIARDNYTKQSRSNWKKFTGFLSLAPKLDSDVFPVLK